MVESGTDGFVRTNEDDEDDDCMNNLMYIQLEYISDVTLHDVCDRQCPMNESMVHFFAK